MEKRTIGAFELSILLAGSGSIQSDLSLEIEWEMRNITALECNESWVNSKAT